MKRYIYWFLLVVFSVLMFGCDSSNDYSATIAEGRSAANDMLVQTGASSISVAFVANEQVIWAESFGYADKSGNIPPTADTMYGIGSVSKMLATIATMRLVDQGKVLLDEPVATYVPAFTMLSPEYTDITVRMLLNHSSGFPGTDYRNAETSGAYLTYADQMLTSLSEEYLKHTPGYLNTYCNDGFTMLEELIKNVSGKSYVEFVQDEILTPLHMEHSGYPLETFPSGTYAKTYSGEEENPFLFGNVYASGGFYSTPSDMAQLALMIMNGGNWGTARVLSKGAIDNMAVDQTVGTFNPVISVNQNFGLGWDTVTEGGLEAVGIKSWSKGGDITGYGAEMLLAPDEHLAVIVIGASGLGSSNALVVAERIMLRALAEKGAISAFPTPLPATPKPVATPTSAELDAISGYFATSGVILRIDVNDDSSLDLFRYNGSTWSTLYTGVKMRDDGMFSSDALPLKEYSTVTGDDRTYFAIKNIAGYGHYQNSELSFQKIYPTAALSSKWNARSGRTWLVVNELYDSLSSSATEPRFEISEPEGLAGLLAVNAYDGMVYIVDPSSSDSLATMLLILPQAGRDLNDLFVIANGDEEWMRFGSYVYRPQGSVAELPATGGTVTIGNEGYAEWRKIDASTAKTIEVVTSGGWRIFDPSLVYVSSHAGSSTASLPAASGSYYLKFYGEPQDSVVVTIH